MTDTTDMLVFWVVVAARFLIPLTIPRYPLPGVIVSLVLDAVDQTIFQQFTHLNLDGYQGYDKALDIYYLTIAYISTLRNWANLFAFKISRFLLYYRLFGVTLFELTYSGSGPRYLLLFFPNTFEYFFIFYEMVRLRWNPVKMSRAFTVGAMWFIWVFIKIPQETWIHIAQLDMTDFIKENLIGVPKDATVSEMVAAINWPVFIVALIAIVVIVWLLWRWISKQLPPVDHGWAIKADPIPAAVEAEMARMKQQPEPFLGPALYEKIALVSLIGIIFAQVLPDVRATNLQLALGVAFVIAINTLVSHWFARRGTEWSSILRQFIVMAVINFGSVVLYSIILPATEGDNSINLGNTLFFALLLTLLVVLFDRYRAVYLARMAVGTGEDDASQAAEPAPAA
jgi:hypothetical protein